MVLEHFVLISYNLPPSNLYIEIMVYKYYIQFTTDYIIFRLFLQYKYDFGLKINFDI